ncbi:hypothetical protein MRX96_035714 [Rhipicephalus microplus]
MVNVYRQSGHQICQRSLNGTKTGGCKGAANARHAASCLVDLQVGLVVGLAVVDLGQTDIRHIQLWMLTLAGDTGCA